MDDTHVSKTPDADSLAARKPLGMSSFNQNEREQFGRTIRLAMACIEGKDEPVSGKALPTDASCLRQRLKSLTRDITSHHADLLELLVRFDDQQGWQTSGARHCAAWMNTEIGLSTKLAWEYLRVGRRLQTLPVVKVLFRGGKLTWSKVRLITRVADKDNELLLCHAALDASVSDVQRICEGFQWNNDDEGAADNDRALKQWESRSLTWNTSSNGGVRIQLSLPAEMAQAFLNSVEHSLNQLDNRDSSMSQRRADAAALMAESSLQYSGKEVASADRYQVIVSVDSLAFPTAKPSTENTPAIKTSMEIPPKRPTLKGFGPIALETARRISCDCSISVNQTINGEPVDIGRKSRIWPNAMTRAIKDRDQHCVWPGCSQSNHLHIHHIKHWADGGTTSVANSACLCSHHHTLVHEGGYTIQRIVSNNDFDEQRLNEQFRRQQHRDDLGMFTVESDLRNDRASFDKLRKLSPTCFRFRVVDSHGQDILDQSITGLSNKNTGISNMEGANNQYDERIQQLTPLDLPRQSTLDVFNAQNSLEAHHAPELPDSHNSPKSTRVASKTIKSVDFHYENKGENKDDLKPSVVAEAAALYHIQPYNKLSAYH